MTVVIHQVDRNADTVIILKNPLTAFAVCDTLEVQDDDASPVQVATLSLSENEEPTVNADEYPDAGESMSETSEESAIEEAASRVTPTVDTTVKSGLTKYSVKEQEIHYHVSSQHLRLASRTFDNMLTKGKWMESAPDSNDGRYHISAEDWDPEAFLLLMNVLHHRNHQVPRNVTLEMFAKVAVLVDYYECAEAVELCTERWIENVRKDSPVPSTVCRDLMLWMCIAWVFGSADEFTKTTAIALKEVDKELLSFDLPITSCIDKILEARMRAIKDVIWHLQNLLAEYSDPNYKCPNDDRPFECGSILYGALFRQIKSAGVSTALLESRCYRLALFPAYTTLKKIRSPSWIIYRASTFRQVQSVHACNLKTRVDEILEVIHSAQGFKLGDFGR